MAELSQLIRKNTSRHSKTELQRRAEAHLSASSLESDDDRRAASTSQVQREKIEGSNGGELVDADMYAARNIAVLQANP